MRLDKVKRPGGVFSFDMRLHAEDGHGVWLFAPVGSPWSAPHDRGALPVDVLVLLADGRPFVTWWVDDPADRRVEIDVCLPPVPAPGAWSFVDLELDPKRHEGTGLVEVEDHDEFEAACEQGWISADEARLAATTAKTMEDALRRRTEPWGAEGWARLDVARSRK